MFLVNKSMFIQKIIITLIFLGLFACTSPETSLESSSQKTLHDMLMSLIDADRERIYAYYGVPTSELDLSPTFKQLVYAQQLWHDLVGELIFYLEGNTIRSIAFVLPQEEQVDEERMNAWMQQWYGDNRERQLVLLEEWYQRDAQQSWFSDALQDVDFMLGERAQHYWFFGDKSNDYAWVIATHNGMYPYEFIALIPVSKFQFGRLDYFVE